MSFDIEARGNSLTSLGDDDSFELTLGETLAGRIIVPGLVQINVVCIEISIRDSKRRCSQPG